MLNAEERGPKTERRTEKGIENRGRRRQAPGALVRTLGGMRKAWDLAS
jgi:hypothetical protein